MSKEKEAAMIGKTRSKSRPRVTTAEFKHYTTEGWDEASSPKVKSKIKDKSKVQQNTRVTRTQSKKKKSKKSPRKRRSSPTNKRIPPRIITPDHEHRDHHPTAAVERLSDLETTSQDDEAAILNDTDRELDDSTHNQTHVETHGRVGSSQLHAPVERHQSAQEPVVDNEHEQDEEEEEEDEEEQEEGGVTMSKEQIRLWAVMKRWIDVHRDPSGWVHDYLPSEADTLKSLAAGLSPWEAAVLLRSKEVPVYDRSIPDALFDLIYWLRWRTLPTARDIYGYGYPTSDTIRQHHSVQEPDWDPDSGLQCVRRCPTDSKRLRVVKAAVRSLLAVRQSGKEGGSLFKGPRYMFADPSARDELEPVIGPLVTNYEMWVLVGDLHRGGPSCTRSMSTSTLTDLAITVRQAPDTVYTRHLLSWCWPTIDVPQTWKETYQGLVKKRI